MWLVRLVTGRLAGWAFSSRQPGYALRTPTTQPTGFGSDPRDQQQPTCPCPSPTDGENPRRKQQTWAAEWVAFGEGKRGNNLITSHITVGHRKQRKKTRLVKFGSLHSCCHATTYTGDPSSNETRQLKLPPLLDSPSGILHPPCLQTSLGKKKT